MYTMSLVFNNFLFQKIHNSSLLSSTILSQLAHTEMKAI